VQEMKKAIITVLDKATEAKAKEAAAQEKMKQELQFIASLKHVDDRVYLCHISFTSLEF
tara:strand:- start:586 stop:762 length:177 start_codon:yes stop_codon:yes gene_type:complete